MEIPIIDDPEATVAPFGTLVSTEVTPEKLGGRVALTEADWAALRAAAVEVARSAYAPYSHLNVGAAALCSDAPARPVPVLQP